MKKTTLSKNRRGVTLIEMMVVISVIVIVTSIMLITYSSTRGSNKLRVAQREVAATIRLAHSYALQGRVQEGESPCGYGLVVMDKSNYKIFYKANSNCTSYNLDKNNLKWNSSSTQASGDKYSLPNGVEFDAPDINKSVYFTVPHGGVYNQEGEKLNEMKYTIISVVNDETAVIKIAPGGRVTEEQM